MLALARKALGVEIRYDHCVTLNRTGGNPGSPWHSHNYGEEYPAFGFLRIFFYVNGFESEDGGLKVILGSHLFRDETIRADSDNALGSGWMAGKNHPVAGAGEPLTIERLSVPTGTVILRWTHAAHGVSPRKQESDTRWTVVYAYRNPRLPSIARWISPEFEEKDVPGAEGLLSLY